MPGSVYERNGIYWIKFYCNGKAYRTSAKTMKITEAKKTLSKYLGEVAAGTFKGFKQDVPSLTMGELLDDFEQDCRERKLRSLYKLISHLKPVRAYFNRYKAADVTVRHIDLFKKQRLAAGIAVGTINRELQPLGQAFKFAKEREFIEKIPLIKKYREDNARQGFFEQHEFEQLMPCLPDYLQDLVRFAYCCGWRKGEITQLEWRDVQQDVIRLRPQISKTKEGRILGVVGEIAAIIERRRAARFDLVPYVFHRRGKRIWDFRKAWNKACTEAGIEGMIFHDLRRTAVRNMVRAGVPERIAMSISGHKTRAIFDRYNIVSEQDVVGAQLKTERHLAELGHNLGTFNKKG